MTSALVVLLPSRRPQFAPRFMESLRATVSDAIVYVATESAGDLVAWMEAGVPMGFICPSSTCYQKLNRLWPLVGHLDPLPEWVFGASDDLIFHPGWYEEALRVAEESGASVIGTNDLGNPHPTHCLIRRSYAEDPGITLDRPEGGYITEAYVHNYVDNEVVELAQRRGVWAVAPDSHVEHLHHAWGKAPHDAVYADSDAHGAADAALFQARMR